jgi:hypothetical protein
MLGGGEDWVDEGWGWITGLIGLFMCSCGIKYQAGGYNTGPYEPSGGA